MFADGSLCERAPMVTKESQALEAALVEGNHPLLAACANAAPLPA